MACRNPLQYYCLGNPMDRGSWQASVYWVAKESDMTQRLSSNNLLRWWGNSKDLVLLPGFTTLLSFFLLLLTLSTSLPLGKTNKQTKNVACPRTPGGCGGAGLDLGPWKPSSVFLLCYVTASNSSFLLKKKRERLVVVFFFSSQGQET